MGCLFSGFFLLPCKPESSLLLLVNVTKQIVEIVIGGREKLKISVLAGLSFC